MFDAVLCVLRRLLAPHRLAVVAAHDGGMWVVEVRSAGGYAADIDLTDIARELAARGLHPDAFAADLARRLIAEALTH